MLDKLNHLKDEMCNELMELTDKKNRSPGDIEMIGEIVDIILDIHRIEDTARAASTAVRANGKPTCAGPSAAMPETVTTGATATPIVAVTMCAGTTPARMAASA